MGEQQTPAKVSDVAMEISSTRGLGPGSGVERWVVRATVSPAEAAGVGAGAAVGRIEVLAVDLAGCPDPWGELDASNDAVAHIGETVFDVNTGQLAEGFDTRLRRRGDRVLVLDYVELEPAWRGHNVAALLVAECLDRLRADCRVVVCLPGPLERPDLGDVDYEEAVRRVRGVWSQVGFVPYRDGVWFLDPTERFREECLARLRARHGLVRHRW
jgi:GNAT superfamily N-acetyltransferase